jgi:D-xylono/L-arabinono-1,4-lactonase
MPEAIEVIANINCDLAENPLWDHETGILYWTDITRGNLYRLDLRSKALRKIYSGEPVGGFTLETDGALLLFRVNDIARLESSGRLSVVRKFTHPGMDRFNDVIADPDGRVFAGTLGRHPKCGLYRFDPDGTSTHLFSGTGCSNGMAFSPDRQTFYWTCSTRRCIYKFAYDGKSGSLGKRFVFHQAAAQDGIPDGLAVDSHGCLWSARWGAASVLRFASDGTVLERIAFPVSNISSLCFAGPKLNQLVVTSAKNPSRTEPSAGNLFTLFVAAEGMLEFRSRLFLKS